MQINSSYFILNRLLFSFIIVFTVFPLDSNSIEQQVNHLNYTSILPPLEPWHGKSERLIQTSENPWQTYSEKTGLTDTANYNDTFAYVDKLVASDERLHKVSLGKSPQGRDIWMIIVTNEGVKEPTGLKKLNKPTLLVQAGIHSGEIDGKDAGLMLIRDIIHGKKGELINKANLLFVPILSVDGHERRSPFNRVNQRGPVNMGWRTNAANLNLNRDYSKLDTLELQHMVRAINHWQPDLYYDVHVTNGEDYQYDITYGFNLSYGESPSISQWLERTLKPTINKSLDENGHKGGPLTFGVNPMEFTEGIIGWAPSPRFSNGYGDFRQLPTVLLENHSLKPYKQRVLGTYIFIESTLKLLASKGNELKIAIENDKNRRPQELVVEWETDNNSLESMDYAGIAYSKKKDKLTGIDFIQWTGELKFYTDLPIFVMKKPKQSVKVPKSFWIPSQYNEIINRLIMHGIKIKRAPNAIELKASQLRVTDFKFKSEPFEGRQMVTASFERGVDQFRLPANSVEVPTDQPLGRLAVALLDPRAPDSFFSWGFFNQIFQRTEYIESYALVPLAHKLFENDVELKVKFQQLKQTDKEFAKDQQIQLEWLYSQSPFYDNKYLNYPILMSM